MLRPAPSAPAHRRRVAAIAALGMLLAAALTPERAHAGEYVALQCDAAHAARHADAHFALSWMDCWDLADFEQCASGDSDNGCVSTHGAYT